MTLSPGTGTLGYEWDIDLDNGFRPAGLFDLSSTTVAGVQVFWGVPDAAAELARLTTLGALVHEPVKDVGGGIKVASVRDPFGNLFSIIENPHFKLPDL